MLRNHGRVVSNFIVQALCGEPISIYGDGLQSRSFYYVSDMVKALVRLMDTEDDFCGPINLGNASEVAIVDLAKEIITLTDSTTPIVFEPLPSDDPVRRCPDISMAREKLDWAPRIGRTEGLKKTIQDFRNRISA